MNTGVYLFMPQCLNGFQPGGFGCRIQTEHHADEHGEPDGQQRDRRREHHGHAGGRGQKPARCPRKPKADQAAHQADGERLDQKLAEDIATGSNNGFADADLPRAFGYGYQHDIHDADAAHQQGDGGNPRQHQRQLGGGLVEGFQHGRLVVDAVAAGGGGLAHELFHVGFHFTLGQINGIGAGGRHIEAADALGAEQTLAQREGDHDQVVAAAGNAVADFVKHAHHGEGVPLIGKGTAHCIHRAEQFHRRLLPQHCHKGTVVVIRFRQETAIAQRPAADLVIPRGNAETNPSSC